MTLAARKVLPWLWLLSGSIASAEYTNYFFTTAQSDWTCPDMTFQCPPPQVCSFNPLLERHVCCDTGSSDAVCWTGSSSCDRNPTRCGSGDGAWCCLAQREECTQRQGQINICWETSANPMANFTSQKMNDTFSSLSSANPTASTLSFNLAAAIGTSSSSSSQPTASSSSSTSQTPTTSSPSVSQTSSSVSQTSPSDTPTSQPTGLGSESSKDGTSPGVIAGAAVGGVVGLALIASVIFFLLKRRRPERGGNPHADNMGENQVTRGYYYAYEADGTSAPAELPTGHDPLELDGKKAVRVV